VFQPTAEHCIPVVVDLISLKLLKGVTVAVRWNHADALTRLDITPRHRAHWLLIPFREQPTG
jgi:hypothetical protein